MALLSNTPGARRFFEVPRFDPSQGKTVLDPPGDGAGHWVGAPDVIYDAESGMFYLYVRYRKPADPGDPEQRGARCSIFRGGDGINFERIWTAHRTQFDTVSIEKGSLLLLPDGRCRLYLSYESPGGGGWQIDVMEAGSFAAIDPAARSTALHPSQVNSHQIKDPIAFQLGNLTLLYANYALEHKGELTGLAVSANGRDFEWKGCVLPASPTGNWDCWTSRGTGIHYADGIWYLFYDGANDISRCYEEQSAVAVGFSPDSFFRLTPDGPIAPASERGDIVYNNGRSFPSVGGIRYLTPVQAGERLIYYYEWTRPDGSHELRACEVE